MRVERYIYWRKDYEPKDGLHFANIHYLVGYNDHSVSAYLDMAAEIRKTFPQATNNDLICGEVRKSHCVKGFSIITYNAWIEKKSYDGWYDKRERADYEW